MIAISGPLTVASKALTAAVDARNEVIASNLAQEGLEYLQNAKDNDDVNATNWNKIGACAASGITCGVSPLAGNDPSTVNSTIVSCSTTISCRLFIGANGYSYDGSGTATPFTRTFSVKKRNQVAGPIAIDYLVTVTVSWKTGTVSNQVKLEKIMEHANTN